MSCRRRGRRRVGTTSSTRATRPGSVATPSRPRTAMTSSARVADEGRDRPRQGRVTDDDDALDGSRRSVVEQQPVGAQGLAPDPGPRRRLGDERPVGGLGEQPGGRPGVVTGHDDGARAERQHLRAVATDAHRGPATASYRASRRRNSAAAELSGFGPDGCTVRRGRSGWREGPPRRSCRVEARGAATRCRGRVGGEEVAVELEVELGRAGREQACESAAQLGFAEDRSGGRSWQGANVPKIPAWVVVWLAPVPRSRSGRSALTTMSRRPVWCASMTAGSRLPTAVPDVVTTATGRRDPVRQAEGEEPGRRARRRARAGAGRRCGRPHRARGRAVPSASPARARRRARRRATAAAGAPARA